MEVSIEPGLEGWVYRWRWRWVQERMWNILDRKVNVSQMPKTRKIEAS